MNSQPVGTQGQISWWVCGTCNMELFNSGIWCIENWREYRSWLTEVHLRNLHLHVPVLALWFRFLYWEYQPYVISNTQVSNGHNISSPYKLSDGTSTYYRQWCDITVMLLNYRQLCMISLILRTMISIFITDFFMLKSKHWLSNETVYAS